MIDNQYIILLVVSGITLVLMLSNLYNRARQTDLRIAQGRVQILEDRVERLELKIALTEADNQRLIGEKNALIQENLELRKRLDAQRNEPKHNTV